MIEYIYNAIRATAGEDITISAKITNDAGEVIESGCGLRLYDGDKMLIRVDGTLIGDVWSFTLPAAATKGLAGRFWYCFCDGEKTLCFREPIYLV